MIDKEFEQVGLYQHNAESYRKIKEAFVRGEDIVGIVHATGTGKTYNAIQLAYDNPDKKIVYVVPSIGIIEHIQKVIRENPNLGSLPNIEFRTYQSFISLSLEEITNIECDILVLDEFHHIGAPVWGARIDTMVKTHPGMKIFGMTAYTVRERGTSYERDMANPETDELFSNKIVSRYDLCDAMLDGIIPKPIYKSAYINILKLEEILEEKVQKLPTKAEYMKILEDVKRKINNAPSIPSILKNNIKPNGKYIYFCPPYSLAGTNDIETIKKQAMEWFKEFIPKDDIVFYTTTSEMREEGKRNREAFYNDVTIDGEKADKKLRVMFAINQYNEGVHAPNIDGVIMGRGTSSDIVYFEQLGRALSVRGNTRETIEKLEEYTKEELMDICKNKGINVKEEYTKEDLIQTLVAPVVIDLTNNYDFIKELENNLKERVRDIQNGDSKNHRIIKLNNFEFDIEIENQDLYEMLRYVMDRLTRTWEEMYEYAKIYYEHHGDLEVKKSFRTNDGYTKDEEGTIKLGIWIDAQRQRTSPESDRGNLLLEIGMRFDRKLSTWEEMYEYAKIYYENHGNLEVKKSFRTNDGHTKDNEGTIHLGKWIANQRKNVSLESDRGNLLLEIGMRFDRKLSTWEEMYEYAKIYYEHHGNLEVEISFRTNDGHTKDNEGTIHLGIWIVNQRQRISPESDRGKLLSAIGMRFDRKLSTWEEMYEYAKIYYEHHGNLEVEKSFRTNDGYTKDEEGTIKLGIWIATQRKNVSLGSDRGKLLSAIGMRFDRKLSTWEEMYEYAKVYYEHHGNLEVKKYFRTNDGYTKDEKGTIKLGIWIYAQRQRTSPESDRGKLLTAIGMRFETRKISKLPWEKMYEYAKIYYEHYGNLEVEKSFRTNDGYTKDNEGTIHLGEWIANQRRRTSPESDRGKLLTAIGMIWGRKKQSKIKDICNLYKIDLEINKRVLSSIGIRELLFKIEFLKSIGLAITDAAGKLHEIFSMSSPDMKIRYGVSLEELIPIEIKKEKSV